MIEGASECCQWQFTFISTVLHGICDEYASPAEAVCDGPNGFGLLQCSLTSVTLCDPEAPGPAQSGPAFRWTARVAT
jgi:hypothetical protein